MKTVTNTHFYSKPGKQTSSEHLNILFAILLVYFYNQKRISFGGYGGYFLIPDNIIK